MTDDSTGTAQITEEEDTVDSVLSIYDEVEEDALPQHVAYEMFTTGKSTPRRADGFDYNAEFDVVSPKRMRLYHLASDLNPKQATVVEDDLGVFHVLIPLDRYIRERSRNINRGRELRRLQSREQGIRAVNASINRKLDMLMNKLS